jgi:hypothetical protein
MIYCVDMHGLCKYSSKKKNLKDELPNEILVDPYDHKLCCIDHSKLSYIVHYFLHVVSLKHLNLNSLHTKCATLVLVMCRT